MTARPAPLAGPVELTTTQERIGSPVPTNQSQMIVTATACNKSASSATVNLWIVPNNETPASDNHLLNDYAVASDATVYLPLSGLTLSTGYSVYARADTASAINLFISVWKITTT